jgi:hypothetical protein
MDSIIVCDVAGREIIQPKNAQVYIIPAHEKVSATLILKWNIVNKSLFHAEKILYQYVHRTTTIQDLVSISDRYPDLHERLGLSAMTLVATDGKAEKSPSYRASICFGGPLRPATTHIFVPKMADLEEGKLPGENFWYVFEMPRVDAGPNIVCPKN